MDTVEKLRNILGSSHSVAMVGLSDKSHRPSYFAAKYLIEHGFNVIPVNPRADSILGRQAYPDLASVPEKIDIVDCFRRSEDMPPLAEQAVAIGAHCLWMQLTVINYDAKRLAEAAGLQVVMDRCTKIEHARIFGGLNYAGVNTRIISARRPRHV